MEASVDAAAAGYLAYHAPRFRFLVDLARSALRPGARRALDIGPSPLTELLRRSLPCPVDTLGLEPDAEGHRRADLNAPETLPKDLPAYDLIVFAEVIEHLHTAPTLVLAALGGLMPPGGALLLQTPNAASLPKRLKLLAGLNPYELIRVDRSNPGHFREYTLSELEAFATGAGFSVRARFRRFYFDARYAHHADGAVRFEPVLGAAKNLAYRILPPFLREGITLVLEKRP